MLSIYVMGIFILIVLVSYCLKKILHRLFLQLLVTSKQILTNVLHVTQKQMEQINIIIVVFDPLGF